jgi:hypothetical protein
VYPPPPSFQSRRFNIITHRTNNNPPFSLSLSSTYHISPNSPHHHHSHSIQTMFTILLTTAALASTTLAAVQTLTQGGQCLQVSGTPSGGSPVTLGACNSANGQMSSTGQQWVCLGSSSFSLSWISWEIGRVVDERFRSLRRGITSEFSCMVQTIVWMLRKTQLLDVLPCEYSIPSPLERLCTDEMN